MLISDSYEEIELRARMQLSHGDYTGALKNYRKLRERLGGLRPSVLERRPELRELHALSMAQEAALSHQQGDFEQAEQLFRQLIEVSPARANTWRRAAALVHIDMGQVETGLDELRANAVASPGDPGVWLSIGQECEAVGRPDDAEECLRRAANLSLDLESQTETYLVLFDFYRAQGRVDEALVAWDKAWSAYEGEADYVFPVYQMFWEAGDLERAQHYLNQEENALRKGLYQGWLDISRDQSGEEGVKHWKRVAKMDPLEFDEGQEAWAEAALRVGVPAQEIVSVLQAVNGSENFTLRGLLLQAIAEARLGHAEHAMPLLEMACNAGRRSRPRREKLSKSDWALFNEMVPDEDVKRQLRHYFEE